MNGAMADPLVSTMSAPKATRATMTGSSQNFLRCRRKPHRSRRNSTPFSVWLVEIVGREHVMALVHHRRAGGLEGAQPQRVMAQQPAHDAHGRDDQVEHRGQEHL